MFTQQQIFRTLCKTAGVVLAVVSLGVTTQTLSFAGEGGDASQEGWPGNQPYSNSTNNLATSAPSQSDLAAAFTEMDINRDGTISRQEYVAYYYKHYGSSSSSQGGMSTEEQMRQRGDNASDGTQPGETPPFSSGDGGR